MKLNVKTGDTVVIIAGKDKGTTGKVIETVPATGRVKVENANIVTRHKKPRSAQVPGGLFKQPAAIDVSNVQIICPSCNKATRVRHADIDSKHVRACAKCGASLDNTAKIDKKKLKKEAAGKPAKSKKKDESKTDSAEKKTKKVKAETAEAVETTETVKKPAAKKTTEKKEGEAAKKPAAKKPAAKKTQTAETPAETPEAEPTEPQA